MDGKHILAMIFTSLFLALMISSCVVSSGSFSGDEYQTFNPSFLPTRQTDEEALSWDIQSQSEPQDTNTTSLSFLVKLQQLDNLFPHNTSSKTLFNTRLKRDTDRVKRLFAITKSASAGDFSSPVSSGFELGSGEYFTRIGVGTPARYFYMVLDTGSDIVWLQCSPCVQCYEQTDPIFNPKNSSSFSGVPCKSQLCNLLDKWKCGRRKQCIYGEAFGDGSVTVGDFSTETLTFGKKKLPKVAFGCGRYNKGLFVVAAGLLGLGRGKLSFPGQAGYKFSYCLATGWGWASSNKSSSTSSHLIFGKSSDYSGKAVYTSLLKNPNPELKTFYYVELEGVSVGRSRVCGIDASAFRIHPKTGGGGVIIDSGTSVTRLRNETYLPLRDAFRNGTKHLKRTSLSGFIFDTCYDLSGMKEVKVPTMDLHFRGGANMSLPASNIIVPVDNNGTHCFAFAGTADSDGGLSIIGNIQQQGFGVAFDLANNRVGFVPKAC